MLVKRYFDFVFLVRNMAMKAKRFIFRSKPSSHCIELKSQLMEEACIAREIPYNRLNSDTIQIFVDGRAMLFVNMNGPSSSVAIKRICDEKMLARDLLRKNNLNVPESILCDVNDEAAMIGFAGEYGFPLVIKPRNMARGYGVFTNIMDERSLVKNIQQLKYMLGGQHHLKIIIEKQFEGDDYRFFMVNRQVVAVSHRIRPHVIGDGISDIKSLIQKKNANRKHNRYLKNFLIPLEKKKLERLFREGRHLQYVPLKGEYVFLRDQSNLSGGGDSIDVTDHTNKAFIRLAVKAVECIPGMHYGGVDFITKDIRLSPEKHDYVITEIEFSPGPISNFPIEGNPRDMAEPILDFYCKDYP